MLLYAWVTKSARLPLRATSISAKREQQSISFAGARSKANCARIPQ